MKTWTRQPNGTYKVTGAVTTRRVRLEIDRRRDYRPVFPIYFRARAEQLITDAIKKGQARADAYRLVEVEGLQLDAAGRARLAGLRARSKATRWREPASTRSEAARRTWETRRKKVGQ